MVVSVKVIDAGPSAGKLVVSASEGVYTVDSAASSANVPLPEVVHNQDVGIELTEPVTLTFALLEHTDCPIPASTEGASVIVMIVCSSTELHVP